MSLVLGYANKENAVIMSDGRAGGTISPSETYDKTRKINDNIILGLVGYKETSEHFLNCVHMDMGERIEICYMDEFLEEVEYGMSLDVTKEKLKSTFMIIGRTKRKEMVSVIVGDSTDYKIEKNIVSSPRILLIGGVIDGKIINDIYVKNIFDKSQKIEDCMRKTIEEVSEIDDSINKNVFIKMI